jgi:hypothetical protein
LKKEFATQTPGMKLPKGNVYIRGIISKGNEYITGIITRGIIGFVRLKCEKLVE